ncbi:MAG TPA: 6,7-dimethyl-8-ribityllumazine synthase [Vicinamibacterales bacterium]|nr:6,7-dimethyl-8-ribityllumazine synthase [Vicinamibacterales bacterium]
MRQGSPQPASDLKADGLRFALVVSRFNDFVTTRLRDAAIEALVAAGASRDDIVVHEVPGSFEIPQAARRVAEVGKVDAVVCLGCLIRGATPHFEYIASAVAHGLTDAAGDTGVPITFGVLTTNTVEEALERAGEGSANKGFEAACAAIEMARLFRAVG